MGAVDLVIQVESPPSVASGLQRVGRAGHQVGAVSRGVVFPKFRGDLVQTAVVVDRMRSGSIESLHVPANPVDVLAQQIVAMCALDDWDVDELESLVRRATPFATLPRSILESVLDMLSGRYPSDEFAELRPRLVWDRVGGTLTGRPGAQRLAVTSGGTIPDRGLYAVFLATGEGSGRRVGELDEEMVYESRVGDVFTLGSSSWRIEDITHDRVLVTPAPGQPGKLPFWHGDALGRPAELGRAVGEFVRELVALKPAAARKRVRATGLDEWAADNLITYLEEQREATRHVPDDRTIVVERFRDELGDWRVAVHSPYGAQVHAPWALCVSARMRERFGVDVQAMHGDDGIVFRLPDLEFDDAGAGAEAELMSLIALEADDVHDLVTSEIGGSALFASRFRECAARALLLPRRRPDRRQALWQQRQRSAQLLEVASKYASFPIILETVRECVQDVFDVPGLVELMRRIGSRAVRLVEVETPTPSPFARSLMFGYVAQFLYEGDSPLAERRAAALSLDPTLLAELLGRGEGAALRDLLDPDALSTTEAELQRTAEGRRCRSAEHVADLVRVLGALPHQAIVDRCVEGTDAKEVSTWLVDLEGDRRLIRVRVAGEERWAAIEDASRLRDALGAALPVGVPEVFLEPVPDPLGDLVARYARTHGPFTAHDVAAWFGLGPAVVTDALRRLVGAGRVVEGELRPIESGGGVHGSDFCDAEVLRTLRRRSLAALRAEVEPVPAVDLARFLPAWQGVGAGLRGTEGVMRAVEQLAGAVVPASALETLVLPGRVGGYSPALLDELTAGGEVLWRGHTALPGDDGWVSLHLAETAHLTLLDPSAELELNAPTATCSTPWRVEARTSSARSPTPSAAPTTRRSRRPCGTSSGPATSATTPSRRCGPCSPVAGRPTGRDGRRRGPPATPAGPRRWARCPDGALPAAGRRCPPAPGHPPRPGAGPCCPRPSPTRRSRSYATAEVLLDRYGVVTRGSVVAEGVVGGFAGVYRVLAAAEESGRVRRGYFVEGLGAAQFATGGAVDRLRAQSRPLPDGRDDDIAPPQPPHHGRPGHPAEGARPTGPGRWCWPPPTRRTPTVPRSPGPSAGVRPRVTAPAARPARWSFSSTARWRSTSSGVARRCCPSPTTRARCRPRPTRSRSPSARAPSARSRSRRPTADRSSDPTTPLAAALAEAGFHATPRGLRLRR